jgi:hypothetical protein
MISLGCCFVFYPSSTWEHTLEHSCSRTLPRKPASEVERGYNIAENRREHMPGSRVPGIVVEFEANLEM